MYSTLHLDMFSGSTIYLLTNGYFTLKYRNDENRRKVLKSSRHFSEIQQQ